MYADAADFAEWKNGRRATGLVFSASTMSQKIGWAFGAFFALKLLERVGFIANVDQTWAAENGLLLLFSLIPAAFGVVTMAILIFYPLTERRVEEIAKELTSRRANGATEVYSI
jgi:GPH family glycoside/pentoside/hexuronide:cation symporter